jgi:predicted PurR-regulated permease PerM
VGDPVPPPVVAAQPEQPPRDRLPSDQVVAMPPAVRIAAAWSWRLLVIGAVLVVASRLLGQFSELVIPVLVALLLTALLGTVVELLSRVLPRGLATGIALIGGLIVISGMLTLVVTQIQASSAELGTQVQQGIQQIHGWLARGPLHVSDKQINHYYDQFRNALANSDQALASGALKVGTTVTRFVAGALIALFTTFFFLYDGRNIWAWIVRLFPRAARNAVDSSGRRGWVSLTAYVRATILVAFVDAIGITVVAAILRVPLAIPIGVLVFLGAFIPIVGAFISGVVAVLVALVAHGLIIALIMLGGVVGVQQLEAHILQPFLMGRLVRLHPLAIVLALTVGGIVAGIVGALFAVPTAAVANAVVTHLASGHANDPVEGEPEPASRRRRRAADHT